MIDSILFTVAVPLLAFVGLFLMASAFLLVSRDVLRVEGRLSRFLGRQIDQAWQVRRPERLIGLTRLLSAGRAAILLCVGYWILRHGVVEPIGLFLFHYDIS
jgi:hypothetical protein